MYRTCIFCSAALGGNDAIEAFPVGRSVAFDAAKGRLWAVCPKCARWNLAPIEERWEAVEAAERIFRDTRLRVQRENVGLAKLRDGTRLIRIGDAVDRELAAWRFGRVMRARFSRALVEPGLAAAGLVSLGAAAFGAPFGIAATIVAVNMARQAGTDLARSYRRTRPFVIVPAAQSPTGRTMRIRWGQLDRVRTALDDAGRIAVEVVSPPRTGNVPFMVRGGAAAAVLHRSLAGINRHGARTQSLDDALDLIGQAGGTEAFMRSTAAGAFSLGIPSLAPQRDTPTFRRLLPWNREPLTDPLPNALAEDHVRALGIEVALSHETERRALEGELAELREMWRQAEEIADIADALPDVPPPDPPHLFAG